MQQEGETSNAELLAAEQHQESAESSEEDEEEDKEEEDEEEEDKEEDEEWSRSELEEQPGVRHPARFLSKARGHHHA